MTYQFDHEPITDCHNFSTQEECPMFEFVCNSGYCKLSKKMIYEQGRPDWCELVRVKRSIDRTEPVENTDQLPCEWCNDGGLYQSSIDISIGQVKEKGKWKLKASYSDMGGTSDEEVNAKFCFNCGRKL